MSKLYAISGVTGMTGNELVRQILIEGSRDHVLGFDNFYASSIDTVADHLQDERFEFFEYDGDTVVLMRDLYGSRVNDVFTVSGKLPDGYDPNINNINPSAKYVHEPSDMTSEEYLPYVVFDSQGRFVFTENLFSGMGEISGTYELTDTGYVCKVEQSYYGWKGYDVKVIEFEFKDMETLELKTDLCMSLAGDLFHVEY